MRAYVGVLVLLMATPSFASNANDENLASRYLTAWMARFPTRATEAGLSRYDAQLETLGPKARRQWVTFNKRTAAAARRRLADPKTPFDQRLDLELVLREAERNVFVFDVLRRPERDPLFWTRIVGNASVFLLVRDNRPESERLQAVAARATLVPRLLGEARQALRPSNAAHIPRAWCELAARQARASAVFYRQGLPRTGARHGRDLHNALRAAGERAATALDAFASHLDGLAAKSTGSPRLGEHYARMFRIVTGDRRGLDEVLAAADQALVEKRVEAAAYGRRLWSKVFAKTVVPRSDVTVLRRLFARLGQDRAQTEEEFIADYRTLVEASVRFVKRLRLVTLPEPLTLHIDRSPAYFVGQSVGGVYPAGPFSPTDDTLLYLPTPSADATEDQRAAFFRDFNHHFNVMITPHEIIPGHYLQLKYAAQHPHKARAVFADGVYVEGWGTFSERLMLDKGWGDGLDRMAHYKKQLENIARTIVDIRVHARGMTQDAVLAFVRDEALQDQQFAGNMWRRSITSAPQLTFYWLGYEAVYGLYTAVEAKAKAEGRPFDVRAFNDAMMELGPVPVRHYRARFGVTD